MRWGWFAAIAGSVTAPVVAFLAPGLFPSAAPSPMAPLVGLGEAVVAPSVPAVPDLMTGPQAAPGLDIEAVSTLLGWAWALLVLAMGFYLVRAYGRLRSEMRTWTPAEVQGSPVLLSADRGPAGSGGRVLRRRDAEVDRGTRGPAAASRLPPRARAPSARATTGCSRQGSPRSC